MNKYDELQRQISELVTKISALEESIKDDKTDEKFEEKVKKCLKQTFCEVSSEHRYSIIQAYCKIFGVSVSIAQDYLDDQLRKARIDKAKYAFICKVKRKMTEKGWNCADLAREIGYSRDALAMFLYDEEISTSALESIANVLDIENYPIM